MSHSLWPHESQHARPPCPSPSPRVHSNSCPLSQWCHPAISSSVVPFTSCEELTHWKDSDAGRDWGQEEKGTTEDEMSGWHHWLDGRESEWTPEDGDGQGGLACCDSWGHKESDMTEQLNWTELNWTWRCNIKDSQWRMWWYLLKCKYDFLDTCLLLYIERHPILWLKLETVIPWDFLCGQSCHWYYFFLSSLYAFSFFFLP